MVWGRAHARVRPAAPRRRKCAARIRRLAGGHVLHRGAGAVARRGLRPLAHRVGRHRASRDLSHQPRGGPLRALSGAAPSQLETGPDRGRHRGGESAGDLVRHLAGAQRAAQAPRRRVRRQASHAELDLRGPSGSHARDRRDGGPDRRGALLSRLRPARHGAELGAGGRGDRLRRAVLRASRRPGRFRGPDGDRSRARSAAPVERFALGGGDRTRREQRHRRDGVRARLAGSGRPAPPGGAGARRAAVDRGNLGPGARSSFTTAPRPDRRTARVAPVRAGGPAGFRLAGGVLPRRFPDAAAGLNLAQLLHPELRAGHPDAEAFVERAFDLHPRALRRLELVPGADERVPLAVVAVQPPQASLQIDELDGARDLHRSGSRANSPRQTAHATTAPARSQNGMSSAGIQGSATVRQSAACSSTPAHPNARPATSPPKALRNGRLESRAGNASANGTSALQPRYPATGGRKRCGQAAGGRARNESSGIRSAPMGASSASAPAPMPSPAQKSPPGFSPARSCPMLRACWMANQAPNSAKASRHKPHQSVTFRTAAAASRRPAPYLSALFSGASLAVLVKRPSTAEGADTPSDITSAAAPATCGVAMLVPWNQRKAASVVLPSASVCCSTPASSPWDLSPPGAAMATSGPNEL